MPDERAPWEQASPRRTTCPAADLAELRELILGAERRRLEELERRLDAAGAHPRGAGRAAARSHCAPRRARPPARPRARARRSRTRSASRFAGTPAPSPPPSSPCSAPRSERRSPRRWRGWSPPSIGRWSTASRPAGSAGGSRPGAPACPTRRSSCKHALVYRVEQVFLIHARHRPAPRPRRGAGPARERRRPHLRHAHRHPRLRGRLLRARSARPAGSAGSPWAS